MKHRESRSLVAELRKLNESELLARRLSYKQEMVNLSLAQVSSQLENPARITAVRKAIARVETALTAKRAEAQ